jgi:hypothetical protein
MMFCPKWIFELACASASADYLSRQIDLRTVAASYATVLSEFYHPISAEEVVGVVESVVRFLDELNAGEDAVPLVNGFCYHRVTYEQPKKLRKMKGLFGSADEAVKTRDYSSNEAVKSFKAYVYALRNEVAEMAPTGWKLSDVEDSAVLEKMSNQNISPLDFI